MTKKSARSEVVLDEHAMRPGLRQRGPVHGGDANSWGKPDQTHAAVSGALFQDEEGDM